MNPLFIEASEFDHTYMEWIDIFLQKIFWKCIHSSSITSEPEQLVKDHKMP